MTILKWALIFFVVSIVAGILGFTGISAASADVARFLFYVFVVIFLVLLILGLTIFRVSGCAWKTGTSSKVRQARPRREARLRARSNFFVSLENRPPPSSPLHHRPSGYDQPFSCWRW
jgi:uncharacterized membrane protein YtjA (UPF0391 family)